MIVKNRFLVICSYGNRYSITAYVILYFITLRVVPSAYFLITTLPLAEAETC